MIITNIIVTVNNTASIVNDNYAVNIDIANNSYA